MGTDALPFLLRGEATLALTAFSVQKRWIKVIFGAIASTGPTVIELLVVAYDRKWWRFGFHFSIRQLLYLYYPDSKCYVATLLGTWNQIRMRNHGGCSVLPVDVRCLIQVGVQIVRPNGLVERPACAPGVNVIAFGVIDDIVLLVCLFYLE